VILIFILKLESDGDLIILCVSNFQTFSILMPSREFHSALALFIIRNTNSIFWKTHIYRNSSNLAILLTPLTHMSLTNQWAAKFRYLNFTSPQQDFALYPNFFLEKFTSQNVVIIIIVKKPEFRNLYDVKSHIACHQCHLSCDHELFVVHCWETTVKSSQVYAIAKLF
jgi:hypothetical protein